jgi:diaminopimelate decarboxylase
MPNLANFPWKDEQIVDLANKYPTPFHLYDEQTIRTQVRNLKAAFAWCPGYRNHFAVKATPNPHILQVLKEEGCGTDCSSITELVLSEKMGYKADEIMFTSNNTPLYEFKKAKKLNALVNMDDLTHVDFLHKNGGLPEMISFRFNPGPARTGNVLIGDPKEAKFGCTEAQMMEAYRKCKDYGVKRFGLHTMVVSNCLKVEELCETARMMFGLVQKLDKELGIKIEMVNLGGGFGIPYRPGETVLDTATVGAGIQEIYKEMIESKGLGPINIVTECGRYITGPAGVLITRVVHRKKTYKNYVGVDACMANLMRPGMYDAYHHITIVQDKVQKPDLPERTSALPDNAKDLITKGAIFDVVGGLCENNDKFCIDRPLQPEPLPGDIAVIHDAGAHGHSMGFNYNGKPRSAEYMTRPDGTTIMIRRGEDMGDLFATIDFGDALALGASGPVGKLWARLSQSKMLLPAVGLAVAAALFAARRK